MEYGTENNNTGFTLREYIEIAVVLVIAIGALKAIYRCCTKLKKKRQIRKNRNLQEVVKSVAMPGNDMIMKTVTQIPATESAPENRELVKQYLRAGIIEKCPPDNQERQIVPYTHEKSPPPSIPISVNASRIPVLPSSYYA